MDPYALLERFARTTRNDKEERDALADAYQGWIDRRGFVPRVRHAGDDKNGKTFAVTGLYARGVYTYFLTTDADAPLLATDYVLVLPRDEREGHYLSD